MILIMDLTESIIIIAIIIYTKQCFHHDSALSKSTLSCGKAGELRDDRLGLELSDWETLLSV